VENEKGMDDSSSIVKVISLTRSEMRRKSFNDANRHLKFEYVEAIDGQSLTHEAIVGSGLFGDKLPYTLGAYGAALSHLRLWEQAIRDERILTIAEDDAIFRIDFGAQHRKLLDAAPPGWDIVLWGWNFDSILSLHSLAGISSAVMLFDQDRLRKNTDTFRHSIGAPTLLPLDKCFGIPAYSISPSGARKFRSACFPLVNFNLHFPLLNRELMNTGIDIAMNRIYATTSSHVAFPPLVVTKNEHSISTIQPGTA